MACPACPFEPVPVVLKLAVPVTLTGPNVLVNGKENGKRSSLTVILEDVPSGTGESVPVLCVRFEVPLKVIAMLASPFFEFCRAPIRIAGQY